jgi:uncharacterized membrane protein YgcG
VAAPWRPLSTLSRPPSPSLRAPSDAAAAILAATWAAVTAARQRAQDAARALKQEQAVVDAIERQYAETYRRLAGKGESDGSPTSARHSAHTFEPAPAPTSTLRASLHAQAAALTNIRATVTDVLAPNSIQYPRWRDQVLQTLRRYALADHVLSAITGPSEDWLLMDEVVLSWIHGTLTAELQDIVRVPDDTAHRIWGALEAQFLGHRQTRILYLETAFRQLAQGDLSMDEYCRQMKTIADTLRTLRAPITDECLVLNLLRGLSPRFDRVTPILTRMKPFPTFAETKNNLLLEKLCLSAIATAAPATALYNAPQAPPFASGGILFTALRSPAAWSSSAAYWLQRGRGRSRGRGRKSGRGGTTGGRRHSPGGSQWPSFYNSWTGTIQMWPGPLADTSAPRPTTPQQVFFAAPPPAAPSAPPQPRRGSFTSLGLRPHPCGGPRPMGGTRSLSPTHPQ